MLTLYSIVLKYFTKKMIFSILKNINFNGKLDIVDFNDQQYTFGAGLPYCKIRFANNSIKKKLAINPSLHLGEGYMNKEIIIEEGNLDNFLSIITSC